MAELLARPEAAEAPPVLRPAGSRLPQAPFELMEPEDLAQGGASDGARWNGAGSGDRPDPLAWYLGRSRETEGDPGTAAGLQAARVQALAPVERPRAVAHGLGLSPEAPVVATGDPDWALPAMAHAALSGRPFVWLPDPAELPELAGGGVSDLTVCAPLRVLTLPLIEGLREATGFRVDRPPFTAVTFQARRLSFLTGRTLEVLSRVVAKHRYHRREPFRRTGWLFMLQDGAPDVDPGVDLFALSDADLDTARDLAGADLLMLHGHAREDIFYVGPDLICGASHEGLSPERGLHLPVCAYEDRCIRPGRRLAAHELSARVLAVNGCSILRLGGGSFAPEYDIGFTFQEGSGGTVVASSRTRWGSHREQVLLYHLLRQGRSVGEAVRLVNNTLPASGSDLPDYQILGEGSWAPFTPEGGEAGRLEVTPSDRGGWDVRGHDLDVQVLEIRLPCFPGPLWLHLDAAPRAPELFHAVAPEPDGGAILFLFSWGRLRLERLALRVRTEPPAADELAGLRRALRNRVYGTLYRRYSSKHKNLERELDSLSTRVARLRGRLGYDPRSYREVEEKSAQAAEVLSRMDRQICEHLLQQVAKRPWVLSEQYLEADGSFAIEEHRPAERECPYCGAPIVRRIVRHQLDPGVGREVDVCVVDGNLWDVPEAGIRPELRGPEFLYRRRPGRYRVRLENVGEHRLRGWLGFRVYQAEGFGVRVRPGCTEVELAPGEVAEVPFTLEAGEGMPAHMEFVKGFWVSSLDVSYFQRSLWFVPDGAQEPAEELPRLAGASTGSRSRTADTGRSG